MYNNNCNHYYYILLRLISRPLADRTHRELLGILYIFLSSVYKREKLFLLVFRHRSWLKSGLGWSCLVFCVMCSLMCKARELQQIMKWGENIPHLIYKVLFRFIVIAMKIK